MHIFCDVPLAPVYIVVMLIPEMLCSLEVDYIAAILLPRKDMGQGGFVPLVAVILIERLVFTRSPSPVFHVESGGRDKPVSYTHLFSALLYNFSYCSLPIRQLHHRKAFCHPVHRPSALLHPPDTDPVSYTHLDVYKRQALLSPNMK